MVGSAWNKQITTFLTLSYYQLLKSPVHHKPQTRSGFLLNVVFTAFCLVLSSAYTAKLAANLSQPQREAGVETIEVRHTRGSCRPYFI